MPYIYYFDYCGWPARVVFDDDGKTVTQSEVWDWKNRKLVPDQTMNFTYGLLHIDLVREVPETQKPRSIAINASRTIEAKKAA